MLTQGYRESNALLSEWIWLRKIAVSQVMERKYCSVENYYFGKQDRRQYEQEGFLARIANEFSASPKSSITPV